MSLAPLRRATRAARHPAVWIGLPLAVLLFLLIAVRPAWDQAGQLGSWVPSEPSRIYARPWVLRVGDRLAASDLEEHLRALDYYHGLFDGEPAIGAFQGHPAGLRIGRRAVPDVSGGPPLPAAVVDVRLDHGQVADLFVDGKRVEQAILEPALLASLYDDTLIERRSVRLADLPEHVPQAFIAAEDASFYHHLGLSALGIARAAWANLRAGTIVQGGSTITQQVAKNRFLNSERSWSRKAHEALLAPLLEARNSKETILAAYLNGVYLGARGRVSLVGVGAAARAYFGKDAEDLSLAEAALLAVMVPAPNRLDPLEAPEAVRQRRDALLERLLELGWQSEEAVRLAQRSAPTAAELSPRGHMAPYFVSHVTALLELRGVSDPGGAGLTVHTTLSEPDQRQAEQAVAEGLRAVEGGRSVDGSEEVPLQAALVSLDPRSGEILAWVGGRDWEQSQFDRVAGARRQAGSLFKPVVVAAAMQERGLGPNRLVSDEPLRVALDGSVWEPRNNDGRFRGPVTVRRALEWSLNVPTVRIALYAGLPAVIRTARSLGIESPLDERPALALGASEVSPLEMARAYATLARSGRRPPLVSILSVTEDGSKRLDEEPPEVATTALDAGVAFQVIAMLRGVMERGTGAGAARFGVGGDIAGKTGTSDEGRDSWFAGVTPGRTTVVWVGYDEPRPTRLSGSRAALPIWARFHRAVQSTAPALAFEMPPGLEAVELDPETGFLASSSCPARITEVLKPFQRPSLRCPLHLDENLILAERAPLLGLDGETLPPDRIESDWEPPTGDGDVVLVEREGRLVLTQRSLLDGQPATGEAMPGASTEPADVSRRSSAGGDPRRAREPASAARADRRRRQAAAPTPPRVDRRASKNQRAPETGPR